MKTDDSTPHSSWNIKANLIRGIAVLFPLYFTFILVRFLVQIFSKPLAPAFRLLSKFFDINIPTPILETLIALSSFIFTIVLIIVSGAIAQRVVGRKIGALIESTLERLPLIRTIYKTLRDIVRMVTGTHTQNYQQVVFVCLPGKDAKTIGFVTGSMRMSSGEEYLSVFVPTVPNITTGFLLYFKPECVEHTDIKPDQALRMFLSAGVLQQ